MADLIKDADVAFARAVVALARQHGMTNMKLELRQSPVMRARDADADFALRRVTWSEGRHAAIGAISFFVEASSTFSEREKGNG